jgi:hypothetical protein
MDDVPSQLIDDCAQLVKANSIQGNKMNNIDVVYTMWANLQKTADMAVGQVCVRAPCSSSSNPQVGFVKQKAVIKVHVEKRINEIVNRLNKTKTEMNNVDFRAQREERDRCARVHSAYKHMRVIASEKSARTNGRSHANNASGKRRKRRAKRRRSS